MKTLWSQTGTKNFQSNSIKTKRNQVLFQAKCCHLHVWPCLRRVLQMPSCFFWANICSVTRLISMLKRGQIWLILSICATLPPSPKADTQCWLYQFHTSGILLGCQFNLDWHPAQGICQIDWLLSFDYFSWLLVSHQLASQVSYSGLFIHSVFSMSKSDLKISS